MFRFQQFLITGALLLMSGAATAGTTTADHSKFEQLQRDFASGPEVTAACLDCHTEAARQMQQTTHWTWEHQMSDGKVLGKKNVVNNFCVATQTNEPRCSSCHVGYGMKDQEKFDFTANNETAVDCLVCHDNSGEYWKAPTMGGSVHTDKPYEWPKGSGNMVPPIDLALAAQSVAKPDRDNCGTCHFYGGGGVPPKKTGYKGGNDGVKAGDRDSSLSMPAMSTDVHMSPDGQNFVCQDCHTAEGHKIAGSRNNPTVHDSVGIDFPGHTDGSRATCESCHDVAPHEGDSKKAKRLNKHTERVACQTCHIPEIAKEVPTKTWWDWSTAGKKKDGKPITVKGDLGRATYVTKKGDFTWEKNLTPTYIWFNGEMNHSVYGEKVEPGADGVIDLVILGGGAEDPKAKLTPFKMMRGKQPWDPINQMMVIPHLFGKDANAYWKSYDWTKAAAAGQKAAGIPFSGTVEFIETTYAIPVNHMVGPADTALGCDTCHGTDDTEEPESQLMQMVWDAEDLL